MSDISIIYRYIGDIERFFPIFPRNDFLLQKSCRDGPTLDDISLIYCNIFNPCEFRWPCFHSCLYNYAMKARGLEKEKTSYFNFAVFTEHRVRVANEIGAGNSKGARFASLVSVLTSLVVGLCFWSMILAFHDNLARIFTSSTSVIAMVNELAQLLAFTILLNCIQPVLSGDKRNILFFQSHMPVS